MTAARALAILAILAGVARADEPAPPAEAAPAQAAPPDEAVMARIRALYEQGDYAGVRRELLAAFEQTRHPSLLFALGQVELNLENYRAAIDYYEKFIATGPAEDQVALAQQAIGAARMRMVQPPVTTSPPGSEPPPVREPRRRAWYASDTVVVALGGVAAGVGAGFVLHGRRLGNDRSGSLRAYDERVDRARAYQWTGVGLAAAGVVTVGVALLRWRLRPDDGEVVVSASESGASVLVGTRW